MGGVLKRMNYRRFNRALNPSMARKNGKTYIASGIAANALIIEKEPAEARQVLFTVSKAISKLNWAMICYLIHLETWSSLVSF